MKRRLINLLKMLSLYFFTGVLLQVFFTSPLFAGNNASLSVKNSKDAYLNLDAKKAKKPLEQNVAKAKLQSSSITGKVTSGDNNEPLPGVNVIEKGTTNGTTTDLDGNFTIEVSEGATLVFSYIGYLKEEVAVGTSTVINISLMPDIHQLQELVVVGYGTMEKKDVTGSVGSVKGSDIVAKGTSSVMEAMQGRIAGVDITQSSVKPGSSLKIQIRGQNSLNSKTTPLYVVDGIVTGDIDFLNPSDIASIDVLKDASSTAIYGSRGSSGVVIITTKNAGQVKSGSKLNVSYDGYYGIRKLARMPEFMGGRQFADYRAMCYLTWEDGNHWDLTSANLVGPLASRNDGSGAYTVANKLYNQDYTDWLGLITQPGHQQNHYLNISGASDKLTYHLGLGYQDEKGNFQQEYMNRYNITLSVNHRPSKYFQTGATINLSQNVYDLGYGNAYKELNKMAPYWNAYNPDGSIIAMPGADPALMSDRGQTGTLSPLAELKAGKKQRNRYDMLASAFMEVTPVAGLSIKSTFAPRYYRSRTGTFNDIIEDTYFNTQPNPTRNAESDNTETFDYTWDNLIDYKTHIGTDHHFNFTGLFSAYSTHTEKLDVYTQGADFSSDWYNLFSGEFVPKNSSSSYSEASLLSYMGRVNYDYKDKYLLTASIRYDGSSKLANQWASFPSVAVAWRASQESFLQGADWLSELKLRASYGQSGNYDISPYSTKTSPATGSTVYYNFGNDVWSGFNVGNPVNTNLAWEKTRELNFGIDFGILRSRINGSVEYYDKLSDGLLMSRKLAVESGVSTMTDNIGSVSNKGVEVILNTVNIQTDDLSWTTSFTFSTNKNAIVSLYGRKEDVISEKRFIGEPISVIYDYRILGIWNQADYDAGRTVYGNHTAIPGEAHTEDVNGDGDLSVDDKVILGYPDPKWIGGMTSSLNYKNWDFSFSIITKQGMLVDDDFSRTYLNQNSRSIVPLASYDYYMPAGVPVIDWNNFVLDANGYATDVGWTTSTKENVDAKYPIFKNGNNGTNYYGDNAYYKDASFVKVKNITLGYTFNPELLKKVSISSLRIYTNILNPFVFTQYEGYDPEFAGTKLKDGNGPANIIYQFGINLKF